MARLCGIVVLLLASVVLAQDKPLSQAELAKKPMYERLLTGDDAKKAAELVQSYRRAMNVQDWAEAKKYAQKLLEFRTQKQGEDHYEVADVRSMPKQVEIQAMLTPEERKQLRETYQRNHQLLQLYQQGQFARATQLGERILATRKQLLGENHPNSATSLDNLAAIYFSMGEYARAEPLMVQARDLRHKLLGENHPDYALSLNNLALLYKSMGEYAKAEPLYLHARDLRQKLLGENDPNYVESLNNLAGQYFSMGEYAKAEPLYVQARDLFKKLLGENHPSYSTSLNNLAATYQYMSAYPRAEPLYVQARDLTKKLLGENHPSYATSLNNLALLYKSMGDYAKAEQLYLQARDLRRMLLGENHPNYAISLKNLAGLYQSMGDYAKAEQLLLECTRSYEMSRIARASGFGRSIGEAGNAYFPLATLSARLNKPQQAFTMLERNLARAFLDVQAERRGQQMTPEQQVRRTRIVNALSPLEKRIGILVTRAKLAEDETKELAEKIAARSKLNVQLADLAAELSTQEVGDFASIQKAIPAGHALLTWVDEVAGQGKGQVQEHWACLVKSTGEPIWVKLPGFGPSQEQAIADNRLTQELRNKLSTISGNPSEVSQLFEKVKAQRITPVLPHLEGIHTIYAICVNQMAGIPIEPMLPDRTISYIPSGTYLARRGKPLDKPNTILAVGDPAFPKQQEGTSWDELPGTNLEINQLRKLFATAGSQFLTRSQASEQQVDALRQSGALSKFKYLHFATHGKTNPLHAFESKIILSQDQPKGEIKAGEPWLNNEISAREVLDYWKLNCELVTLSACETALGISGNGDGLLGFAQSFLLSGSRSVCVSLWKVDDLATMLLMDRFYRNLLEKQQPKAVALHEAKTWLRNLSAQDADRATETLAKSLPRGTRGEITIKERIKSDRPEDKPYAHPQYWSAFILIGDPE